MLLEASVEVEQFCRSQGWRFCFIGGLAVQRWGEPRLTLDADLTLITGFGGEASFVDALARQFQLRREDGREFALRHRVVLLSAGDDVPVDISLGALPFEERAVDRASAWDADVGATITTCCAEDLIVFKAFAGRERDWLDIEGVAVRQGGKLDEALIWLEVEPLLALKEATEDAERLRSILALGR
jgi:hypothetical protein